MLQNMERQLATDLLTSNNVGIENGKIIYRFNIISGYLAWEQGITHLTLADEVLDEGNDTCKHPDWQRQLSPVQNREFQ
jgi:hypothetical protein